MRDYIDKEANRRSDEIERYSEWIDKNEEKIVERYIESIEDVSDVPDDFVEDEYQKFLNQNK